MRGPGRVPVGPVAAAPGVEGGQRRPIGEHGLVGRPGPPAAGAVERAGGPPARAAAGPHAAQERSGLPGGGVGEQRLVGLGAAVEDVAAHQVEAFAGQDPAEVLVGAQRQDQRAAAGAQQQLAGADALHATAALLLVEHAVDLGDDRGGQPGVPRQVVAADQVAALGVGHGALGHRAEHLLLPAHRPAPRVLPEREAAPLFSLASSSRANTLRSCASRKWYSGAS